jgi:hypothetical protein
LLLNIYIGKEKEFQEKLRHFSNLFSLFEKELKHGLKRYYDFESFQYEKEIVIFKVSKWTIKDNSRNGKFSSRRDDANLIKFTMPKVICCSYSDETKESARL